MLRISKEQAAFKVKCRTLPEALQANQKTEELLTRTFAKHETRKLQNTVGQGAAVLAKAKAICQAEINSQPSFTVAPNAEHLVQLARSREAVRFLSLLLLSEVGCRFNSTTVLEHTR